MSELSETENSSLVYIRYAPEIAPPSITDQLVDCYREVFATKPWGEWKKCLHCDDQWGKEPEDRPAMSSHVFRCTAYHPSIFQT